MQLLISSSSAQHSNTSTSHTTKPTTGAGLHTIVPSPATKYTESIFLTRTMNTLLPTTPARALFTESSATRPDDVDPTKEQGYTSDTQAMPSSNATSSSSEFEEIVTELAGYLQMTSAEIKHMMSLKTASDATQST